MDLVGIAKSIMAASKKRLPELLIGMAIGGFFTATVAAVKAAPEMYEDLEEVKKNEEMTKQERHVEEAKVIVKHQIPAIVIFSVSLIAVMSADKIHCKRNAAMAIVVEASSAAVKEYRTIVREVTGEEKAREVERIYEERERERARAETYNRANTQPVTIITGDECWIRDEFTNTIFKSNINTVIAAMNECNTRVFDEMYISLNEFYEEIGIKDAKVNSAVGWNNNTGLIKIKWNSVIEDCRPIVTMEYINPPKEGFRESW